LVGSHFYSKPQVLSSEELSEPPSYIPEEDNRLHNMYLCATNPNALWKLLGSKDNRIHVNWWNWFTVQGNYGRELSIDSIKNVWSVIRDSQQINSPTSCTWVACNLEKPEYLKSIQNSLAVDTAKSHFYDIDQITKLPIGRKKFCILIIIFFIRRGIELLQRAIR
jgi:hypothetical protein